MEILSIDTRKKAHEGVDVPLVVLGEPKIGDDGKPVTYRLKGSDDLEVHRVLVAQTNVGRDRTPEEIIASDTAICMAAIIGWSDNWTLDGEKPKFSKAVLEKLVEIPLFRAYYAREVFDRARFMNGPSDKPKPTSGN